MLNLFSGPRMEGRNIPLKKQFNYQTSFFEHL